jgi:hypothetical protein
MQWHVRNVRDYLFLLLDAIFEKEKETNDWILQEISSQVHLSQK